MQRSRGYSLRKVAAVVTAVAVGTAGLALFPRLASAAGTLTWKDTGAKTVPDGSGLFAAQAAPLKLEVSASGQCAELTYPTDSATATMTKAGQGPWTFDFPAPNGPAGPKTVSVSTFQRRECTGPKAESNLAKGFVLDTLGPDVTAVLAPVPNASGWSSKETTITWKATDAGGSGIASGPTPGTDKVTADGTVVRTATATDRVGNSSTGSMTVKLDKSAPGVKVARTPAANANGWNATPVEVAFTCDDSVSGIVACSESVTVTANGANQSVEGRAVDLAGNVTTVPVTGINIDTEPPMVTGTLLDTPNGNGWFNDNVRVRWTTADAVSGIDAATAPRADDLIAGEGANLLAMARAFDLAGNVGVGRTGPVNIDRTAPTTTADAPSGWNNIAVDVLLRAEDNLSGVSATHYQVDGGPQQVGTGIRVDAEGEHRIDFWSVDQAGNRESPRTITVKIDRTPPLIRAVLSPIENLFGWRNRDVTITYECESTGAAVTECSPPDTVATEGRDQARSGRVVDEAGNVATAPVSLHIDKTAPTIEASTSRQPNTAGWFKGDVTVSFSCADGLSGIAACPESRMFGEGVSEAFSAVARDQAGNEASATAGPIRIDVTDPTIDGALSEEGRNAAGWYRSDAKVSWSCSDNLAGLAGACPAASIVTGEGAALSVAASVADAAGNAATALVTGVAIDRTPPTTAASVPTARDNGWHRDAVPVTLSPTDNLSGVASTFYRIDDGEPQLYDGTFTVRDVGRHTISFWSTDVAGNAEPVGAGNQITVAIDGIAPAVTATRSPEANPYGWNNTPVTVSFACSDAESGLAGACPRPTRIEAEGPAQSASGSVSDQAGNIGVGFVGDINIDLTPPRVTGHPSTEPNASGWYRDDVVVDWTVTDDLSGPDPATVVQPSRVTGEGDALVAGPVEARDRAGNPGTATLAGIKIDRTPPEVTATVVDADGAPREPRNGWYDSAVRVRFACADTLSGVAACADDQILGDGVWESVTGAGADNAGNVGEFRLPAINVDSVPPVTSAAMNCLGGGGFCRGDKATVRLTAGQAGFAGVAEIRATVAGQEEQVFAGDDALVEVPLAAGTGTAELSFYAVDVAGNREAPKQVTVRFDNLAPVLTARLDPVPNAAGWNNSDVTVSFDVSDDQGGAGVASAPEPTRVTTEGADQVVEGRATDGAGNVGRQEVRLSVDKTAPSIEAAPDAPPSDTGWYRSPVRVSFSCEDGLSGVATCPQARTLSDDGADQSVSGVAFDNAGNRAETVARGIKIDTTEPATAAQLPAPLESGWYGGPVTVTLSATDATSGVSEIRYRIDDRPDWHRYEGPFDFTEQGTHSIRFWAVDAAGNFEAARAAENTIVIRVDSLPPKVQLSSRTAATAHGWNNTPVVLTFSCADDESDVAACPPRQVVETPGSGQSVSVEAIDLAGNRTPITVEDINIDMTPPELTGSTSELNAARWSTGDVQVTWSATDGLSGIDEKTMPGNVVLKDEGRDQQVTATVRDKAGNEATGASPTASIDRTPPLVEAAATTEPNASGWYRGPVTVQFDCSDRLSGVASCTGAATLEANGADQSATGAATDTAGNTAEDTLSGIDIDRTPPTSSITADCSPERPCRGDSVPVRLRAVDQEGLSGVASIRYRVGSADERVVEGDAGEVSVPLSPAEVGATTVTYWAVDRAGNAETPNVTSISFDNVAPTVRHVVDPALNAAGWAKTGVGIDFISDDADVVEEPVDVRVDRQVDNLSVIGTARDAAGNTGTDTATVKVDLTDPSIEATIAGQPVNGWYNRPVSVRFACADVNSGVARCEGTTTLTANAPDQSVTGTVRDLAGRSASQTVGGINIDAQAPTVAIGGIADGGVYVLGAVPTPACTASDAGSGLASDCTGSLTGGNADGTGFRTYTASATDRAGNTTVARATFQVVYRFDGFLGPVGEASGGSSAPASPTTGAGSSAGKARLFNAGGTIPVRFQLKRGDGSLVTPAAPPAWLAPLSVGPLSSVSTTQPEAVPATSGNVYAVDAAAGWHHYNWQTSRSQGGAYWLVGVALPDGTKRTVLLGLR